MALKPEFQQVLEEAAHWKHGGLTKSLLIVAPLLFMACDPITVCGCSPPFEGLLGIEASATSVVVGDTVTVTAEVTSTSVVVQWAWSSEPLTGVADEISRTQDALTLVALTEGSVLVQASDPRSASVSVAITVGPAPN